ncbi:ATP-binding protein [Streptomyces sp. JJ36]|nr:ATP-binding protein [Streptomyces sp. JJ36]
MVGRSRDITRGFLAARCPESSTEDAESVLLVVSELVTNAVRHGGGLMRFRLREVGRDAVEVVVDDASPRYPFPRPLGGDRPGGFGLHLVQAMSRSMGVRPVAGGGKAVHAVIPCRPAHGPDADPTENLSLSMVRTGTGNTADTGSAADGGNTARVSGTA